MENEIKVHRERASSFPTSKKVTPTFHFLQTGDSKFHCFQSTQSLVCQLWGSLTHPPPAKKSKQQAEDSFRVAYFKLISHHSASITIRTVEEGP